MKRAFVVGIVLALAFVSVLPRPASAERVIRYAWPDVTGEIVHIDDDVYELEDYLDNPSLPTPSRLSPTNVFGDGFRRASSDGETWRMLAPIVPGCADAGGQSISNVDSGGVDAGDGSLRFIHAGAASSTRVTRAPVTAAGQFTMEYRFRPDAWSAGTNLTVLMSTVSSNTTLHVCGGITLVPGGYGVGIYTVPSGSLFISQAFLMTPTRIVKCGSSSLVGYDTTQRIARTGDSFSWRLESGVYRYCDFASFGETVSPGAPMYLTFDFLTTGADLVMFDYYRMTNLQNPAGANMAGTFKSSFTANVTLPDTGGNSYERPTRIEIFANRCPDAGAFNDPFIGPFALINDADWTVIYSPPAWNGFYVIPTDLAYYGVLTIPAGAITTDGPYRFRTFLWTEDYNCVWISEIRITMSGDVPPPPPPPPGGNDLPGFLDEAIGGTACGLIFVGFFIVFFVSAKRMKGGG